ncbi:MAG: hypothetical protein R3E58_06970 [Phycisphaerae bacterium]
MVALTQADDGMTLSDSMSVYPHRTPLKVPSTQELLLKVRELADRLLKIRSAPKLESAYSGPGTGRCAGCHGDFCGMFANRFDGGQNGLGKSYSPDDFEKKIGSLPSTPRWRSMIQFKKNGKRNWLSGDWSLRRSCRRSEADAGRHGQRL